jgi:hypothetical protein
MMFLTLDQFPSFEKVGGPCVEASWNTSTIAVQTIKSKKKKEPVAWYNWATLSLGDINTGTWFLGLRVGHKADEIAV